MTPRLECILTLFLVPACTAQPPVETQTGSEVLLYLNDEPLYQADYDTFLQIDPRELNVTHEAVRMARRKDFLSFRLLLQKAGDAGVVVPAEAVEQYMALNFSQEAEVSPAAVKAVTEYLVAQQYLSSLIAERIEVSLGEAMQYYEENSGQFTVDERVRVLEILVESRSEAEVLRSRIVEEGLQVFRAVAAVHSKGVTAERGGDLGYFERGDLPQRFENVIFALTPGSVSDVFQSTQGYHLFLVEEKLPRHDQKFYEVQEDILQQLRAQKERRAVETVLNDILADASIRVVDPKFKVDFLE